MDAKRKTAKRNTTKNNDDNVNGTKYNDIGNRVLVMVKDERTLESVKSYLVDGREICMKKRWLRYLKQINDHTRSLAKGSNGGINQISEESRLLLEEEGKIRNFLFGNKQNDRESNNDEPRKRKTAMMNVIPSWKKKRRRIQEEKNRGSTLMETSEDRKQSAALDEAIEETENFEVEILSSTVFPDDDNQDYEMDEFEGLFHAEKIDDLRVMIHTYNNTEGEQAYLLLNDVRPDYIVLYDAEPSFIRSIEIHSATQSEHQLRVYFMLFEASSEEKNYLRAVEREQNAFERLIQHKKTMALPLNMLGPCSTQEMLLAGGNGVGGSYNSGSLPLSIDTRTGRGKKVNNEKRDIAVDVREFRSGLPSILHQGGMRLAPVTLTVGDFVLSNVHCVERKSISDLFGSFASGRLLTQAQQMSKHYKVPCLLIEFQPSKSFCLQNANEIGPDLRVDGVCGKMSLLMMHVPQLRFLWSRSPHETLKIFKSLKTNHEEVDVDKAVAIGSNESFDALLMQDDGEGGENGNTAAEVNEAAKEMLLKLPGITIHNARQVMNVCDSIAELANLPREKMKELLGARPGQNLFTFFHQTDY
jgi:DNA excision repair protein ERCC-4